MDSESNSEATEATELAENSNPPKRRRLAMAGRAKGKSVVAARRGKKRK
jgi:hypothetical protein